MSAGSDKSQATFRKTRAARSNAIIAARRGRRRRPARASGRRSPPARPALPYLAALLDDPDPDLRAEGVGGLGAFANGLPVQTSANVPSLGYLQRPASAPYMTKETDANFALGPGAETEPRLSFWKTWWLQNRTSLGY